MEKEISRQGIHVAFGSFFIAAALLFGILNALAAALVALALGLLLAALIMRGVRVPLVCSIVECVQRGHERHLPGKGAFMLCAGIILTLALGIVFFQSPAIATGALAVLVYGDAASTLFGVRYGKHKWRGLSLEGTLGGIAVSFGVLAPFFPFHAALGAAIAGMLAEHLPIDDSFTIPVAAVAALVLLA